MNVWRLLILTIILAVGGCSKSADPIVPKTEQLLGRLTTTRQLLTLPVKSTDSVSLRVTGTHYTLGHFTHATGLCDSEGTVGDFGSNVATFFPTARVGFNCDSMRVLSGVVNCDWAGDSLSITKRVDSLDVIWELRLKVTGTS